MTIIRTANLDILESWLTGGQTDQITGVCEGNFNTFDTDHEDCIEALRTNGELDLEKIKSAIVDLIVEHGDFAYLEQKYFVHWDQKFRFKTPNQKNLMILAARIKENIECSLECAGVVK